MVMVEQELLSSDALHYKLTRQRLGHGHVGPLKVNGDRSWRFFILSRLVTLERNTSMLYKADLQVWELNRDRELGAPFLTGKLLLNLLLSTRDYHS